MNRSVYLFETFIVEYMLLLRDMLNTCRAIEFLNQGNKTKQKFKFNTTHMFSLGQQFFF